MNQGYEGRLGIAQADALDSLRTATHAATCRAAIRKG
jgi:hypothetical protein